MIKNKKQNDGWEFLFIGANIDAVEAAENLGIEGENAVNYHADEQGTKTVFESLSATFKEFRECVPISPDWNKKIEKDFNCREWFPHAAILIQCKITRRKVLCSGR